MLAHTDSRFPISELGLDMIPMSMVFWYSSCADLQCREYAEWNSGYAITPKWCVESGQERTFLINFYLFIVGEDNVRA